LIFAVKTKPSSSMFASVIINRQDVQSSKRLKSKDRFDILHTKDFNPNSSELILFREGVEKEHVGTYLVSLCKFFYDQESKADLLLDYSKAQAVQKNELHQSKLIYQCKHCYTVCEEDTCSLCDAPKEDFIQVSENAIWLPALTG